MAVWTTYFLLLVISISSGRSEEPGTVEDISPEAAKKGETAFMNCTVSRQKSNKVCWGKLLGSGGEIWISSDTEILTTNSAIGSTRKYEAIRDNLGNDRTSYTLVINRLEELDSGTYKCFMYLERENPSVWPHKFGILAVQVPPVIVYPKKPDTEMEVPSGFMGVLSCSATGFPIPNIVWTRPDGKPLPVHTLSHTGNALMIRNTRKEDRGIYRCTAHNGVFAPAYIDIGLTVIFKPEVVAVTDRVGLAQNQGLSGILECQALGNPKPDFRWYKTTPSGHVSVNACEKYDINEVYPPNSDTRVEEVRVSLRILNVQANDYAVYACEAINNQGVSLANVTLYNKFLYMKKKNKPE